MIVVAGHNSHVAALVTIWLPRLPVSGTSSQNFFKNVNEECVFYATRSTIECQFLTIKYLRYGRIYLTNARPVHKFILHDTMHSFHVLF